MKGTPVSAGRLLAVILAQRIGPKVSPLPVSSSDVSTHQVSRGPIRLSPRTYTPDEIAALNRKLRLEGDAAFSPAEQLLADIEAGKRPTRKEAPAWFHHPDERVQLALLERKELTPTPLSDGRSNLRYLTVWATALAYAAAEGVVWTPVLDYISTVRGGDYCLAAP